MYAGSGRRFPTETHRPAGVLESEEKGAQQLGNVRPNSIRIHLDHELSNAGASSFAHGVVVCLGLHDVVRDNLGGRGGGGGVNIRHRQTPTNDDIRGISRQERMQILALPRTDSFLC